MLTYTYERQDIIKVEGWECRKKKGLSDLALPLATLKLFPFLYSLSSRNLVRVRLPYLLLIRSSNTTVPHKNQLTNYEFVNVI
jgi:hypothetical protein